MENKINKKQKKMKKDFFSYSLILLICLALALSFVNVVNAAVQYAKTDYYSAPKYEPMPIYYEPAPIDSKKEPAKAPLPPPEEKKVVIDPCAAVSCPDTCEGNIAKSSGKCVNGACVYDSKQTCPSQGCSGSYILSGGCKAGKCAFSSSTECPKVRCYGETMGIKPICQISSGTATCIYQSTVQRCTERCGQNDGCGTCPNDDAGRCGYCIYSNIRIGCEFEGRCYENGFVGSINNVMRRCICYDSECSMQRNFNSRTIKNFFNIFR